MILNKVLGSKVVDNPLTLLPYGDNANGIHRATTADILHTLESGIFPRIFNVVFGPLSDGQRKEVDDYVGMLFSNNANRSGERNSDYLRDKFIYGYTKDTERSAADRVGQLFVLAILLTFSGLTLAEFGATTWGMFPCFLSGFYQTFYV